MGFPGGLEFKASAWNARDLGSVPGWGRFPGEGKYQPTPALLPGKSHGKMSLAGYSSWGHERVRLNNNDNNRYGTATMETMIVCIWGTTGYQSSGLELYLL